MARTPERVPSSLARTAEQSVMTLQRSVGNRAVGGLIEARRLDVHRAPLEVIDARDPHQQVDDEGHRRALKAQTEKEAKEVQKALKKGGKAGLGAVSQLVPLAGRVANTALAAAALDKTLEHIDNLEALPASSPRLAAVVDYAVAQKRKKAMRKLAAVLQVGALASLSSGISAFLKTVGDEKGDERRRNAQALFDLAKGGDAQAKSVVAELCGGIDEPLGQGGVDVIMDKLKST